MDKKKIDDYFNNNFKKYYDRYLDPVKKVGKNLMAVCPFHEDHDPSLSIDDKEGLFNCFGCNAAGDIYEFYAKQHGLDAQSDFKIILEGIAKDFGIMNGNQHEKPKIVARYDYEDESGHIKYQIERLEPKRFRIRLPDGNGGWTYGKGNVRIVPYHLPDIIKDSDIIIVEGEKDADNLIELGFTATTNPFGAGKWPDDFGPYFAKKDVILIPDNDEPGRQHMARVAENLRGNAKSIKYLELPDLPEKGDVSDFIEIFASTEEAKERLAILIGEAKIYEPSENDLLTKDYTESGNSSFYEDISRDKHSNLKSLAWPNPLSAEAFHGIIGEWVKRVEPHTEADPAALLFQALVCFGNMFGPNSHFMVEATEHRCNENTLLIGNTSKGRKGTSWDHVRYAAKVIDSGWEHECIKSGLTSGEGIIYHVRDAQEKQGKTSADPGITDKRLLAYEAEFANILKIIERKDNTLSATIRDAWDHGTLRTLAKNSPVKATGAHISIISHITKAELMARLSNTESFNGFANRFLFVCVKRSKMLPEGGGTVDLSGILPRFNQAVKFARTVREMRRDEDARAVWCGVYKELTRDQPGILGSVLARDAAHVVRLSMIYALLDCSALIKREHLLAALACWEYVESSARYIFESMTGDPIADKIYEHAIQAGYVGLTRTYINNVIFKRNVASERINQAIKYLQKTGKIKNNQVVTEGRAENRISITS